MSESFALRPHQKNLQTKNILTDASPSVLLFHGTGSGKTCSSLVLVKQSFSWAKRVFVLGDKLIRAQFKHEIQTGECGLGVGSMHKIHTEYGYRKFFNAFQHAPPGTFDQNIFIIDEIQRVKNSTEKIVQVRALIAFFKNLVLHNNCRVILLSATPMTDRAEEIRDILALLYQTNTRTEIPTSEYKLSPKEFTQKYLPHVRVSYVRFPVGEDDGYPDTREFVVRVDLTDAQRTIYKALTNNVDRERLVNDFKLPFLIKQLKARKRQIQVIYTGIVSHNDKRYGLSNLLEKLHAIGYRPYDSQDPHDMAYAVLSGSTPAVMRQAILTVVRSPENRHGEKISLLIGTQVLAVGVDLKNVRAIHILEPFWNFSAIDQIKGRGMRYQSHIDLPHAERVITTYTYIAPHTIDAYKVKRSKKKDLQIKQIEYLLRTHAFDCKELAETNRIDKKYDNTRKCQYRSCSVRCANKNDIEERESIYVSKDFTEYRRALAATLRLFREKKIVYRNELVRDHPKLLDMLVHNLKHTIDETHVMYDVYGRQGYLIEMGDHFMVCPQTITYTNVFSVFGISNQYTPIDTSRDTGENPVVDAAVDVGVPMGIDPYGPEMDKNAPAYGYVMPNGQLGIVQDPVGFLSRDIFDKRYVHRGKTCTSYSITSLQELARQLGVSGRPPTSRLGLCKAIQQKLVEKGWMFNRKHTMRDADQYWKKEKKR